MPKKVPPAVEGDGPPLEDGRPRGGSVVLAVVVWLGVALVGAGVWAMLGPVAQWWGSEPVVGSGYTWPSEAPPPTPVLPPLEPEPVSDAAGVARAVAKIPVPDGVKVSVAILDATSGNPVAKINPGPQTPASTMKVLTSVAALEVLGAEHRFSTAVVAGKADRIVLVGGGDPLLATAKKDAAGGASLEQLADETAAELKAAGLTSVSLAYDDSLFKGPAWHPEWPESFKWSVAPVTALKADQARLHRPTPGDSAIARDPNPSLRAANDFGRLLAKRGIKVSGATRGRAPADATALASVSSAPVSEIVETLLRISDNDATEALARHVAKATGRPASFEGSAAAVSEVLPKLGIWTKGMAIHDTSGISVNNRVSPESLAKAIRLGITQERFRPLVTGLPVAGVSGTLTRRFTPEAALPGRGYIRAKTGTIRGVNTLAGYAASSDGHVYTFGLMTSGGTQGAAQAWLDAASSVLAR